MRKQLVERERKGGSCCLPSLSAVAGGCSFSCGSARVYNITEINHNTVLLKVARSFIK